MAEAGDSFPGPGEPVPFDTRPASRMPRRPLLGVALVFLIGTAAGLQVAVSFQIPLMVSLLALVGVCTLPRSGAASLLLFSSLFSAGWAGASFSAQPPGRTQLTRLLQRPAEAISVRGVIVGDPVFESRNPEVSHGEWVFLLAVHEADRVGELVPVHGRVQCRWQAAEVNPSFGQRWLFQGVLRDQHRLQPGSFRRHRLTLSVVGPGPRLLEEGEGNPLYAACFRARRAAARILDAGLSDQPEKAGVLKALLLGYRSDLSDDLQQTFKVTGTLHVFAISGLHVGVFGSLVVFLLRTLGIPRHRWSLLLAPLLIGYVIATGMKPSALRACVMALAFWSGPTFWRKPDASSAMALAALLIVGARPQELVSPGFILSFSVVVGILLLYPLFIRPVRACLEPDPWRRDPEPFALRQSRRLAVAAGSLFALSLACWLISFPLSARMFSLFSPVGLLGNLAVVPGALLVVLTGCLSLIVGSFSLVAAEIFNHANAVFIGGLLLVVKGMSQVPFGHRFVEPPAIGWILAWYGLLGGWRMMSPPRRIRWAPVLPLVIGIWILSWLLPGRAGWLQITSADGASIVQLNAGREIILIGAGDEWRAEQMVGRLHGRGVNRVRALVLTRLGEDELDAAEQLLTGIPVTELWLPGAIDLDEARRLRSHGVRLRRLRQGERGVLDDGTEWEMLALPAPGLGGMVMRIARGVQAVIFMADPHPAVQYALTRSPVEPAANTLVVSDPDRPPVLLPAWVHDTGATRILASRKRRLTRDDDYAKWRKDLESLSLEVQLVPHGEHVELPAPGCRRATGGSPSVSAF